MTSPKPRSFTRIFSSGDSLNLSESGTASAADPNAKNNYFTVKLEGNTNASDDAPLLGLTEDFEVAVRRVVIHNINSRVNFPFLVAHNMSRLGIESFKRRPGQANSSIPIGYVGGMSVAGTSMPGVPTYCPIKSTYLPEITFQLRNISDSLPLFLGVGVTSIECHFRPRGVGMR